MSQINLRGQGYQPRPATDAEISQIAALLGAPTGNTSPTNIAFSAAINLTIPGAGAQMPEYIVTSPITFTIAPGAVSEGTCAVDLIGDGNPSHVPNFSAFNLINGYVYDYTAGVRNSYLFGYKAAPATTTPYGTLWGFVVSTTTPPPTPIAPVFTAQTPPSATVGIVYTYTYAATGATSFAIGSGSIPSGLSFNMTTGVLSGTPTTAQTSTFVINAINTVGTTTGSTSSIVIASSSSGITFSAQSAPGGAVGTAYTYTFVASDGSVPAPVFSAQSAPGGTVGTSYSYTFVAS